MSLSAAVNRIFSLCSRIPTVSFRPLPVIRPWLSDCFRRPAYGFKSVTCDPTAANQPVCCDLTAPSGHFPASRAHLSSPLLRPNRICRPESSPQTCGLISAVFPVFDPSPFAAIFFVSEQPSVLPTALLLYSLFYTIISVTFLQHCF